MRLGFGGGLLVGLVACLGVACASPARGDRGHHGESARRGGGTHYSEVHGDRHEHRRAWRHGERRRHRARAYDRYRGAPRYTYAARDAAYYCAACRHRFASRPAFHDHLVGVHAIPLWRIPFVVVHGLVNGVLGWVFYG